MRFVHLYSPNLMNVSPSHRNFLAENNTKIALLSGTKSVIDPAVFASENILLQYLQKISVMLTQPLRV